MALLMEFEALGLVSLREDEAHLDDSLHGDIPCGGYLLEGVVLCFDRIGNVRCPCLDVSS